MVIHFNPREPHYNNDSDYNTNSPSYYDDLARKNELIKMLAKRIWEYEETINSSLENIEKVLREVINKIGEGFNKEINDLLIQWVEDGTLDHIINTTIFNDLNDKIDKNETDLNNKVDVIETDLNNKVDTIESNLNSEILKLVNNLNDLVTNYNETKKIYNNGRDFNFSMLDYQSLLGSTVTSIVDGSSSRFPQGMVMDYENDKYYVSRQTSGKYNDQRIYEYELGTDKLLRVKDVPTSNWVYLEGIALYHNNSNEICFVIPTKRAGEFGLYNFDKGVLEIKFSMEGSFKTCIDNNNKYFVCSRHGDYSDDALNSTINGFLLYDLQSVMNASPVLVKTVKISNSDMLNPKSQTVTMIDDIIFIGTGIDTVGIKAIDTSGNVLYRVSYNRKQTLKLIGGNVDTNSNMENEGVSWAIIDGKTHLVSTVLTQGKMGIILHGDLTGTKLERTIDNESVDGLAELEDGAFFSLVKKSGVPSIDTGVGNALNIYKVIEALRNAGMYTIYAHSDTINIPIARNMTGFMYARSANDDGITRAIVYLMDTNGTTYTNIYDVNHGQTKWLGWNQFGSRGVSLTSDETFDPLKSFNGSVETSHPTHAPTEHRDSIKHYRITQFGSNRKWIECYIPSTNQYYTRSIHTNGELTDWKEYT